MPHRSTQVEHGADAASATAWMLCRNIHVWFNMYGKPWFSGIDYLADCMTRYMARNGVGRHIAWPVCGSPGQDAVHTAQYLSSHSFMSDLASAKCSAARLRASNMPAPGLRLMSNSRSRPLGQLGPKAGNLASMGGFASQEWGLLILRASETRVEPKVLLTVIMLPRLGKLVSLRRAVHLAGWVGLG